MSYLVLARKYRPKTFEQMIGQPHVVQALTNALTHARLHHAYLFTGTRGVGKTTVSRILAKSLNCTGPDGSGGVTARPCGVCAACAEIDAGRHVDYIELDAASNRSVEEMTQLLDQAMYKPVAGRFKIYMIDEVHMLTGHAFNAMLKTLEEPPEYLKFVLATTDPQKVPVTVLSRCLQFNLRPMAAQDIVEHLGHVLRDERVGFDAGSLKLLARAAKGSMRDALSLTDQAIAYGAGTLAEGHVRQMLGAVDRSHAARLVRALADGDGKALIAAADELRALGLSAAGTLEELAALAQQVALRHAVPDALDADDPDAAAAAQLAPLLPPDEAQLLYSLALHGRAELALAPDEYAGLVMVLLRFLAFKPAGGGAGVRPAPPRATTPVPARPTTTAATRPVAAPSVDARPAAPARAAEPVPPPWVDEEWPLDEPGDAPRSVAAPATPAPTPPVRPLLQPTPLGDRWTDIVAALVERGELSPLARELAMQSQCVAVDGDRWALRVDSDSLRNQADKLRLALAALLGTSVQLGVERGTPDDTPALRAAAERERRQRDAEAVIHADPLVQEMLAQFKTARIVPGSIKPH
jgi:DNA polymerase-3 subunit gamma/tau